MLNRRSFLQLTSGAALAAASHRTWGLSYSPSISGHSGIVRVTDANYIWEYAKSSDTFELRDRKGRLIVGGRLQPAVVVAPVHSPMVRQCSLGEPGQPTIEGSRVTILYEGVNGAGRLKMVWRFDQHGIWTEPILYDAPAGQDVVSLHYFAELHEGLPQPSLDASYFVVPGISEASTISPIVGRDVGLEESVWLGRGSFSPGLSQQWGLPVHYFCGFSVGSEGGAMRDSYSEQTSDAFTCGLSDLPAGDLFLALKNGRSGPWIDYRSDLWKHLRGPGSINLGATFCWAVAPDYYQAIGSYYHSLLQAGVIHRATPSAKKISTALAPQFCTWGSQVDRNKGNDRLDEAYLREIYAELKASGLQARMFSIDDKWEGNYGNLEHSASRLPHFEQFLDELRSNGYLIGFWAALMRCEHPESLGLTTDNMLKRPDGTPYAILNSHGQTQYYILDLTQPEVATVLEEIARRFMRRYKIDLLKFDFGYEMPSMAVAAPRDKQWSGERLMRKGLDVIIKAMRQENPDLVVMYYQLSPLFLDYFDLFSPDDLFLNSGEYDFEANRRFFFSSLLGQLGIPTYSSSGYDWASAANIWFDASALGTIGSLNDFRADERGESGSPELTAKYNGLTHAVRPTTTFDILPLDDQLDAPTLGAHPRSWARFESGQLVMMAYRPPVPWEPRPLASRTNDPRVNGAVRSSVPVVVSSQTSENLSTTERLAIVPYGGGEIVIRRNAGKQAEIVAHYFDEKTATRSEAAIENRELRVMARERDQTGAPLEWIEVNIS